MTDDHWTLWNHTRTEPRTERPSELLFSFRHLSETSP